MHTSVIVAGARTPIGRFNGALARLSATDLGGIAIREALVKAGIARDAVQYVIMGQVLTAGAGQMPARRAAVNAGIPMTVPALNINKACLSGIESIILADQFIRSGAFDVVVAGGMESMTQAPHLLPNSHAGFNHGDITLLDHMAYDGLQDAFTQQSMGLLSEADNNVDAITRDDQDAFAARSHQLADTAWSNGVFDNEVVPIDVWGKDGGSTRILRDEGIRPATTVETLSRLRPAFRDDGSITAGNASTISDGACAVVVMSRERAEDQGLSWIAEIGDHGMAAGPDSGIRLQPANAVTDACNRAGISPAALDLVEINEAFATVSVASIRALGIDPDRVNVNGGAIALGHPIGTSGTRITLHLALELQRRGGGVGVAALCGGGGQGEALILHVPPGRT